MDHQVHAWRFEYKLGGPLVAARRTMRLPERSVKVLFSHFVCASLCSASVGMNSGDLLPTWPLPVQQVVLVGIRTKVVAAKTNVGEGNGWKNGSYIRYIMSY
ncbi:hypothetical protein E2C01_081481 [Portunus trituberculatus]|uniref:Uncharacterized protein n=1 Tax=Portunus trituberculatus TaxID=210409 RepID=A0A5B7IYA8_PORTR|nr:hypothetical protein [Portunus trituberculatus]